MAALAQQKTGTTTKSTFGDTKGTINFDEIESLCFLVLFFVLLVARSYWAKPGGIHKLLKAIFDSDQRRYFISQTRIVHFEQRVNSDQEVWCGVHLESDCSVYHVEVSPLTELNVGEDNGISNQGGKTVIHFV